MPRVLRQQALGPVDQVQRPQQVQRRRRRSLALHRVDAFTIHSASAGSGRHATQSERERQKQADKQSGAARSRIDSIGSPNRTRNSHCKIDSVGSSMDSEVEVQHDNGRNRKREHAQKLRGAEGQKPDIIKPLKMYRCQKIATRFQVLDGTEFDAGVKRGRVRPGRPSRMRGVTTSRSRQRFGASSDPRHHPEGHLRPPRPRPMLLQYTET